MTTKDTGGPAFPVPLNPGESYQGHAMCDGMTIRDYFAAKAMQGLMQIYWDTDSEYGSAAELIKCQTTAAYEYADAMLEARGK